MIKRFLALLIIGSFLLAPIGSTPIVLAEDDANALISDLHYDQEKQVLTGKTAPNANISLADVVATIVADEQGLFEIPIPSGLERTTLTFMDFINDESTDVDYDFVAGTIATTEPDTSAAAEEVNQAATDASSQKQTVNSVAKPPSAEQESVKKDAPIILWVLLLVLLIGLTVVSLILYRKRDLQLNESETSETKGRTRRSQGKKRRRRSNKTD